MRTISQVVEEELARSPFLSEVVSEGVGNNAAIARRLKPLVEKRLLEDVSESAIAMALHRVGKAIQRPVYGSRFVKQMNDITVRSNLLEYVFKNSRYAADTLEEISKAAAKNDIFFSFSRGLHETVVIVSNEFEAAIDALLSKKEGVQKTVALSAVTMRLPEESLSVPGVYYPILRALALEGVNFEEVISIRTELSIIFHDRDVDRAFAILKRITT